jgi:hypothetical protein
MHDGGLDGAAAAHRTRPGAATAPFVVRSTLGEQEAAVRLTTISRTPVR